uniref:S-phase kinase-associated protein 1 n=1 Tax=Allium cepa TaxID=4679 RepID=A0A089VET5_ALLCE|nr:S-phase kinase-associated protein 1 [Allium cepa]
MGESERATIKPEDIKSFIWIKTADGSIQQVEEDVASHYLLIFADRNHAGMGSSRNYPISLPPRVNEASLNAILDFCRFHQVSGRSNKERKTFNENFVKMDTERLLELSSAADALQIAPLVHLTCTALARKIDEKSPEEVREIFHLPDDLTEEEKLEPFRNICDPRIRLLNRLNAKKRKELEEEKLSKNAETEESADVGGDKRSVDDLLSFINGEDEDKCKKVKKNKKKTKRRKDPPKDNSSDGSKNTHEKEAACNRNDDPSSTNPSTSSMLQDFANIELDDDDDAFSDLDLEPEEKEKLDREIEEFAKRLNDEWLSRGKQPKLIPNISSDSIRRVQD